VISKQRAVKKISPWL